MTTEKTYKVTFKRSNKEFVVTQNTNLLDLAFKNQINIPSLCRGGSCGTCRVKILSGKVELESQKLDISACNEGYTLACSARVIQNIVVDA